MKEQTIYKSKDSKRIVSPGCADIFCVDMEDPSSRNIERIVETYSKQIKKSEIASDELVLIVHEIVMENILWVGSDMKKEIIQITNKIKFKKKLEFYPLDYINKQIIQHYKTIYKRKNI